MDEDEYIDCDYLAACPYCGCVVELEVLYDLKEDGETDDYECDRCEKPFRIRVTFYDPSYEVMKLSEGALEGKER